MERTARNQLPYIMPQQAQKHVTHNEAIRLIDALIQIAVSGVENDPGTLSMQEGQCVLVGDDPVGGFADHVEDLACFVDGAWMFHKPVEGWLAYRTDINALLAYTVDGWNLVSGVPDEIQNINWIGINAVADAINRFSVNAPASLFNHSGHGHQLKVNKVSLSETASVLFQTDFAGRAEIGTVGDDDFRLKVSDDQGNWRDALSVNHLDGKVSFPNGISSLPLHGVPEDAKGADLIYIDALNGSDENSGKGFDAPIRSFARLAEILPLGRKLEIRLLSDIVADYSIALSHAVAKLLIRGRSSDDGSATRRTITVKNAANEISRPGGFVFEANANVFLNVVNVDLQTSKAHAFLDFSSSIGYLRTRLMDVTRSGTGACCVFGNTDSFVANSHTGLIVNDSAKGFFAKGLEPNANPNDDWRYPSNLNEY